MSLWIRCGIGHCWVLSLAVLGVLLLSTPTWAFEHEGTVIYFALENLQLDLRHLRQRDNLPSLIPQMNQLTLQTDQAWTDRAQHEVGQRPGHRRLSPP
jgi:hypothetical protein